MQLDGYKFLEKKGEGTYGIVWRAQDNGNKEIVAVKQIKLENEDEGVPSTALREIAILKELQNHPNIVELKKVIYEPRVQKLALIFQYIDQDLKLFAETNKILLYKNKYIVKCIIYQILVGLHFCHSRRILHRDLKPQNILIDKQFNIKIADFGLARAFGLPIKTLTHEVETLWYRAPEILMGQKQYSLGVDVWSVGVIFAELTQQKPLFVGVSEIDQIFKIFQFFGTPQPDDNLWRGIETLEFYKPNFPKFKAQNPKNLLSNFDDIGLDLVLKMITLDPKKRPSIKDCLEHQYFQDIKQEDLKKYKIDPDSIQ